MQFRMNLLGVQQVNARIEELKRTIPATIATTVLNDAEKISQESGHEVPIDTQSLHDSKYVESEVASNKIRVEIGYGGPHAKINPKTGQSTDTYAIKVHEDLTMNHPNGGKAKFLEDPFRRHLKFIARNIINAVRSLARLR